ncbi:hypothetical protein [Actinophytocola sp.]|uniref:hypothetical protein n=1 Tax=Actinophytocola sp. TaxID=1872138 RepID=UPI003899A468
MSSDNRARTRAIREQMAASGENYTRAAHTVPVSPARNLRAVCFTCQRDVPAGEGVIHISHREVRQAEQAQTVARARVTKADEEGTPFTAADLLAESQEARWQVHCDDCNPHRDDGCAGCYWFAVERCSTWAQLVDWTVHLSEKEWVLSATDWMEFIRATAQGSSQVGLICHPADRYKDLL